MGVGVPYVGMRMLVPSLESSPTHPNYRGRPVFLGLGVAWLLWAGAAILGGLALTNIPALAAAPAAPIVILAGPLVLVAFALGLVDDAFGTGGDRGFRGHLGAIARGRLTTGGMKLLGISLASLIAAVIVLHSRTDAYSMALAPTLLAIPAGAGIALSSNFVNLTDLRPGRALKAYSVLAVLGIVSSAVGLVPTSARSIREVAASVVVLGLFAFGPVLAVWRYDLGERGMLGDAGANPAGVFAGLLIVAGLPAWGIIVYFVVMFALNLASERFSFSRVIESSALLTRLDALGRAPAEPGEIDAPA